ncbi:MAG: sugar ABC transporter ATP-binding protein [Spirochaetia bacterium]|nr:sugar ABC transporter ATP-binding protein [Spirochaetia bacterium]
MNDTNNLLKMQGISKEFPGVKALQDVDFSLSAGEVRILIGENGAGKSTLMKILAGVYQADSGTITFDGNELELDGLTPRKALEMGIATIYQELNLNNYTSVYENIFYGKELLRAGLFIDIKGQIREAKKLLDIVGLDVDPCTRIMDLSIAEMQMVEIAKALSFNAKIIIFDEPTSSLSETETRTLFSIIANLKQQGYGIIYISHRLEELFEIGDTCTVLRDGRYIDTRAVKDLTIPELIKMMVGRMVDASQTHTRSVIEDVVLDVQHLSYRDRVKDVSFTLKKGECLAFAGLVGSGRTEIAKTLIGEYTRASGTVRYHGKEIENKSVAESVKNGIVYLSEDRKKEGLFLKHSVQMNIAISSLQKLMKRKLLDPGKIRKTSLSSIEQLNIKTPNDQVNAETLSGGNQQKVIIAKWLLTQAQVYIFDEPTRGIDVGAKAEIYKLMESLLAEGASIIMISSEMPEVLRMADRILIMREGCCQAIIENDNLSQEDVLHYAIGANTYHVCT